MNTSKLWESNLRNSERRVCCSAGDALSVLASATHRRHLNAAQWHIAEAPRGSMMVPTCCFVPVLQSVSFVAHAGRKRKDIRHPMVAAEVKWVDQPFLCSSGPPSCVRAHDNTHMTGRDLRIQNPAGRARITATA